MYVILQSLLRCGLALVGLYCRPSGIGKLTSLRSECSLEFRGRRDDIKILKAASCAPSKVHTQEHENQEM